MMFAGAAFDKLVGGHFTLRWALSDNLRNQLLTHYDLVGLSRTPVASWLIDDAWRFRCAALLNLVSQTMPIVACVFVTRPYVRVFAGAFFAIETIALGLVVNLWNLHWLPLVAVFVDWDRWLPRSSGPTTSVPRSGRPRAVAAFLVAFVALDLATSLIPGLDQQLNLYPFSGFPMFARIRVQPPYDQHLPYTVVAGRYEVGSDRAVDPDQQRWFDDQHRRLVSERDPAALHRRLTALFAQARARYPELGIHHIRYRASLFVSPAYPAPAHFDVHPLAVLGEIDDGDRFRSALGRLDGSRLVLGPGAGPASRFVYFRDGDPTAYELAARATAAGYEVSVPEAAIDIAAIIDGEPWLVATR
jgi:hypothetical protein